MTSIQSIALAAQMDRGSAFQRQGVSGTERRPAEEEEEDEEGEGPWKLNGCRGMKGFVCQQQDIKASERAGKSWSEGLMSGCEKSSSMKCSQRSCCCFNHARTSLFIYLFIYFLTLNSFQSDQDFIEHNTLEHTGFNSSICFHARLAIFFSSHVFLYLTYNRWHHLDGNRNGVKEKKN